MFKFLIDECLSPGLAILAKANGFQAFHVNWRKLDATRDSVIALQAIAEECVMVTNNGTDYRAIYRTMDIHPGLVVIIPSMKLDGQKRLFQAVLDRIRGQEDLINRLIEVDIDGNVMIRDFPPISSNY